MDKKDNSKKSLIDSEILDILLIGFILIPSIVFIGRICDYSIAYIFKCLLKGFLTTLIVFVIRFRYAVILFITTLFD